MNLSGTPLDYIAVFLGGVLWSFTPCVYPLLPVIIGYIGASACDSRRRAFLLTLSYTSGTAVVYSLLGIAASLSGRFFSGIFASYQSRIISGVIILFFGLVMMDIVRLPSFAAVKGLKNGGNRGGLFWAFLLGCSSALLISPCLTPVLGSILVYLSGRQNVFFGATLLLVFAYGMGLIFILGGTFGYLLSRMPKSGAWLIWIKRLCALLLAAAGITFIVQGIIRSSL